MKFGHNIAYMVNSYVVSLGITVMINISQETIKILHEKNDRFAKSNRFVLIPQRCTNEK